MERKSNPVAEDVAEGGCGRHFTMCNKVFQIQPIRKLKSKLKRNMALKRKGAGRERRVRIWKYRLQRFLDAGKGTKILIRPDPFRCCEMQQMSFTFVYTRILGKGKKTGWISCDRPGNRDIKFAFPTLHRISAGGRRIFAGTDDMQQNIPFLF